MKDSIKNKIFYIVASLVMVLSLILGVSFLDKKNARAEGNMSVTFETGASVRLDTSEKATSGIRFRATIGSGLYDMLIENGRFQTNAELGMMIVPDSYITDYNTAGATDYFTYFTSETGKNMRREQFSKNFSVGQIQSIDENTYCISGAMHNLKDYSRAFRAIVYYKTDGTAYTYTLNGEARSITQVAVAAINGEQERFEQENKYYTDEELDVLYTYADGQTPRVIFDADKGTVEGLSHIDKIFTKKKITDNTDITDITGAYEVGAEIVEDKYKENWFAYTVKETENVSGNFTIFSYDKTEEGGLAADLEKYRYVHLRVRSNNGNVQFGLCKPAEWGKYTGWYSFAGNAAEHDVNEEIIFTITKERFLSEDLCIVVKNVSPGNIIYASDFVAYGGNIPTQEEDPNFDPTQPQTLFNPLKEEDRARFTPLGEGYTMEGIAKGEIFTCRKPIAGTDQFTETQETMERDSFKITVGNGVTGEISIQYSYSLSGLSTNRYDYMIFLLTIHSATHLEIRLCQVDGTVVAKIGEYTGDEYIHAPCVFTISQTPFYDCADGRGYLEITGLGAGDVVIISEIAGYNAATIQAKIDALPSAEDIINGNFVPFEGKPSLEEAYSLYKETVISPIDDYIMQYATSYIDENGVRVYESNVLDLDKFYAVQAAVDEKLNKATTK